MYHLIANCYSVEAKLIFDDKIILSTREFHQGEALANILFCLLLHLLVKKIKEEVPTLLLNCWLYDSGSFIKAKEDVVKAVRIILSMFGAHLEVLKEEVKIP